MNTQEQISLGLVIRFENRTTKWGTTLKYLDIAIPKYLYPDMRTIYLTLPYAEVDNCRRYFRRQDKYFFFKLDSQKKMKSLLTKLKNKEKKHNADRTED